MKGLNVLEDSVEYILYLNGKPAARYDTDGDAFNDIQHLTRAGHKPKLMKQVCNTVPLDEDAAASISGMIFESTDTSDLLEMLKKFLPIVQDQLQLKSFPKIKPVLRLDHGQHPSFGMYVNETNTIELAISDRHPVDILRTLAHELVHCKQREDNRLKPDSGETGSDEENEANAVAGVIMRNFDDANPEVFDEKPIKLGENIASLGRRTANYIRNIGQPENPSATLYTNPEYRGSKISNQAINDRPIVNVPIKSLTPWEPDDKMTYTGNRMNVLSMVSAIEQGKQLPPIITVKKGNTYLILDGHHRYEAYRQAGVKTVPVKVLDPKEIRYSDEVLHELDDKVKPKSWDDYGQPAAPRKKKPEEKVFTGWQHYTDAIKSKDEKKKEVKEGTDYAKGNIDYHDTLNPLAWQNNSLRKEVRARLLEIAKVFVDYLDIPQFEVSDIVLTGSMANYNYTEQSDFDLHIITDYAALQCEDLAEALYQAKKHIWNDAHDITIYGHDVEMYIEDISKPPVSSGVYSVLSNQWLKKPENNPQDIDQEAVNSKVRSLIDQIYRALADANDPTDIKRLIEKLRKMRRSALEIGGEFSIENLAYKIIRNEGYLQHIYDTLVSITDQQLSLNENFTPIEIAIMEGGHSLDE